MIACAGAWAGCGGPVVYRGPASCWIDVKGYTYCALCGARRRMSGVAARPLRRREIARLDRGLTISYTPRSAADYAARDRADAVRDA